MKDAMDAIGAMGAIGELALAGIVVALAVVVAAFFGLRGLRPRDSVKREDAADPLRNPREPKFGDGDGESSAKQNPAESSAAEAGGGVGGTDEKGRGARPVQPVLEMPSFVPPKLPEPPEELIPLDICHAVRLHCRGEESEWLSAADLAPLESGLRECGLPVFRFLSCDAKGEWGAAKRDGGDGGDGGKFPHWLMALPLADRGGPMTEAKIKAVERETRRFAELRKLQPVFPPVGLSLENARLVDDFCGRVDIEIVLHVEGSARPSRGGVEKMLRLQGLEAEPESPDGGGGGGGLVWRRDGEVRYGVYLRKSASAPGDVSRAVFRLDVPNVSDAARAFDEMLECAMKVARVFFFQVRDPEGNEIGEERARELRLLALGVAEDMRKHGVAPGGDVARLLFS